MRSLGIKMIALAAVAMLSAPVFAQSDTRSAKADVVAELTPSKIIDFATGQEDGFCWDARSNATWRTRLQ